MRKLQLANMVGKSQPTSFTTTRYKPSAYSTPSKYDKGLIYEQNQSENRAYNQNNWEALGIKTANTLQNIIPAAVENVVLLPSLFMGSQKSREYTEATDKIFSQLKNGFGEVYTEGDDGAWWIDSLGSIVESGASFALTGGAIGIGLKIPGMLLGATRARKMASVIQSINKGATLEDIAKGTQVVENLANTYFTSAVEGQLNGLESSKAILQKYKTDLIYRNKIDKQAKLKGVTSEEYLKSVQNSAFSTAANISTMIGVPLNFSGISSIFTSGKALASYKKAITGSSMFDDVANLTENLLKEAPKKRTWKEYGKILGQEAIQEGIEEGGQNLAGKIGEARASKGKESIALGDYYTAFKELEELGTKAYDKDFFVSMMLGSLGGIVQTGFIQGISNQNKVQEQNEKNYNVLKNDFLNNVETVQNKKQEIDKILESIKTKDDYDNNKDKIAELRNEIYNITVKETLKRNSTDLLINDLKEILNIKDTDSPKSKVQEKLKEYKDTTLLPYIDSLGMKEEEFMLIETNPSGLSPDVQEQIKTSPEYKQYKKIQEELNNSSETPFAEEFEEDYKETATKKIEELKSMQKDFNNFHPYYPSNNEAQKLNTIDVFTKKKKLTEYTNAYTKREEELALQNIDEELEKILKDDLDYQVLLEEELEQENWDKENIPKPKDVIPSLKKSEAYKKIVAQETRENDKILKELKEKADKLKKELDLISTNEYYEALNDFKVIDKVGNNLKKDTTEEIQKKLEIDNFNNLLNNEYRKEISSKQEINKKVQESIETFENIKELFIELLKNSSIDQAADKLREVLLYLPKTTDNISALEVLFQDKEVLDAIAYAVSQTKDVTNKGTSNITVQVDSFAVEDYMEENEIDELVITQEQYNTIVTSNAEETIDNLTNALLAIYPDLPLSEEYIIESISKFTLSSIQNTIDTAIERLKNIEWNPIKKEKLKSKDEVLKNFLNNIIQSIESSIVSLGMQEDLADISELEKEKEKLDAFKVYLKENKEWEIDGTDAILDNLEELYNITKSKIVANIDKNKNNEIEKYKSYSTIASTNSANLDILKQQISIKKNNNPSIAKYIYSILSSVAYRDNKDKLKEDTFNLISRYEITDNLIKVLGKDNDTLKKELETLQKVFKEFAGREAELYYDTPLFNDTIFQEELIKVVKDKYPTPEQIIAIKQALALILNKKHTFIQGLAGTGKTTVVTKYISDILTNMGYNIEATAIGEKVHTKINQELGKNGKSINNGITEYVTGLKQNSIVIIDEAPKMTEIEVQELIKELNKRSDITILFTGDPRQLQGNKNVSATAIFSENIQIHLTIPLTNSKRTGNSNILKLQNTYTKGTDVSKEIFVYETADGKIVEGVKSVNTKEQLLSQNVDTTDIVIITNNKEKYNDAEYEVLIPIDAQGMDWNTVLIDLDDTATQEERYVAASRAKNTVIVIDNFKSNEVIHTERKVDNSRFKDNETWFNETFKGQKKKEKKKEEVEKETLQDKRQKELKATITDKSILDKIEKVKEKHNNTDKDRVYREVVKYAIQTEKGNNLFETYKAEDTVNNLNEKFEYRVTAGLFLEGKTSMFTEAQVTDILRDLTTLIAKIKAGKNYLHNEKEKNLFAEIIKQLRKTNNKKDTALANQLEAIQSITSPYKGDNYAIYNGEKKTAKTSKELILWINEKYETEVLGLSAPINTLEDDTDTPSLTYHINNKNLTRLLERENLNDIIVYEVYGKTKKGDVTIYAVADIEGDGNFKEIGRRYDEKAEKNQLQDKKPIYTRAQVRVKGIKNPIAIATKKINVEKTNKIEKITNSESSSLSDKMVQLIESVKELAGGENPTVEYSFKIASKEKDVEYGVFESNYILPSGSVYLKLVINKNRVFNIPVDGAVITENNNQEFKEIVTVLNKIKEIENEDFVFMSSKPSSIEIGNKKIPQGELFESLMLKAEGEEITGAEDKKTAVNSYYETLSESQKQYLAELREKLYSQEVNNSFNHKDKTSYNLVETNKDQVAQGNVTILEDKGDGYFLVQKSNYSKDIVIRKVINVVHDKDKESVLHQIKMDYSVTESNEIDTNIEPSVNIFYVGKVFDNEQGIENKEINTKFNSFQRQYDKSSILVYSSSNTSLFDKSKNYTLQEIEENVLNYDKTGTSDKGTKLYKKRTGLQRSFDKIVSANKYAQGTILLRKESRDEKEFPIWLSTMNEKHQSTNDTKEMIDTRDVLDAFVTSKLYTPLQKEDIENFDNSPSTNSEFLKKITTRSGGFRKSNLILEDTQEVEITNIPTIKEIGTLQEELQEIKVNLQNYSLQELQEKSNYLDSQKRSSKDAITKKEYKEIVKEIEETIVKKTKDCP